MVFADLALLAVTSMLTQSLASHKEVLRSKTERIDLLTEEIRGLSTRQKTDLEVLQELKDRVRIRTERQAKVANLKREIEKKRKELHTRSNSNKTGDVTVEPAWLNHAASQDLVSLDPTHAQPDPELRHFITTQLPSTSVLRAYLNAYNTNNTNLQRNADLLKSRSIELESMYRKVVSLCTGVAEDKVEENLSALVAAVESEQGNLGEQEVGRVRDFLRRVDGAQSQPILASNPTVSAGNE